MIRFFVPGIPAPGGSKKAFVIAGKARIVEDCKRNADWRATVATVASEAMQGVEMSRGPLEVWFQFYLPRPKSHFGKTGLRGAASYYPTVKPDVTKLVRSTEDALKGITWADDSQIVTQWSEKRYAEPGTRPGCYIRIAEL
jgi:Holliday junction resolvase RusA-like endonuclease